MRIVKKTSDLLILLMVNIIKLYQKTLSPDHGFFKNKHPYGYCRFTPTCSQYGIDVLKKHGLFKGLSKIIWRILRCNPWGSGGNDPA